MLFLKKIILTWNVRKRKNRKQMYRKWNPYRLWNVLTVEMHGNWYIDWHRHRQHYHFRRFICRTKKRCRRHTRELRQNIFCLIKRENKLGRFIQKSLSHWSWSIPICVSASAVWGLQDVALFLLMGLYVMSLFFRIWDDVTGAFAARFCKQSKEQKLCSQHFRCIELKKKTQLEQSESRFCFQQI